MSDIEIRTDGEVRQSDMIVAKIEFIAPAAHLDLCGNWCDGQTWAEHSNHQDIVIEDLEDQVDDLKEQVEDLTKENSRLRAALAASADGDPAQVAK